VKRFISLLLVLIMVLGGAASLTGCGQKKNALTTADWLMQVEDAFGMYTYRTEEPYVAGMSLDDPNYQAVQIAGDWGLLPEDFSAEDLGKPITNEEAAAMLAKTVGIEDFSGMTDEEIAKYAADNGYMANGWSGGSWGSGSAVDVDSAAASIERAKEAWLERDNVREGNVVYADGVVVADESVISDPIFSYDDTANTIVIPENAVQGLQPGQVVVVPNLPPYGESGAFRIAEVRNENGITVINYSNEELQLGDVFDELHLNYAQPIDFTQIGRQIAARLQNVSKSTFERPTVSPLGNYTTAPHVQEIKTFTTKDYDAFWSFLGGINVKKEIKVGGISVAITNSSNSLKFEVSGELSDSLSVSSTTEISDLRPVFEIDYSTGWFDIPTGVNRMTTYLEYTVGQEFGLAAEIEAEIPIGPPIPIPLDCGVSGGILASMEIQFSLTITVGGEISVSAQLVGKSGIEVSGSNVRQIKDIKKQEEVTLKAKVELTPGVEFSLSILKGLGEAGAGIKGGIGAEAERMLAQKNDSGNWETEGERSDMGPECLDVTAYWIAKGVFSVSGLWGLVEKNKTLTILGKDNAKIKQWHFEAWSAEEGWQEASTYLNGKFEKNCWYDKDHDDETTSASDDDTTDPGGNSNDTFDQIQLGKFTYILDVGESEAIVASPPGGYNQNQMTYSSSNTAVATVSGNTIRAVGAGTATITIKCGAFTETVSVVVYEQQAPVAFSSDTQEANVMRI